MRATYADDLMIIAKSLGELLLKVATWKSGIEKKDPSVKTGKTKLIFWHKSRLERNPVLPVKYFLIVWTF